MEKQIEKFLFQELGLAENTPLLLAVSGGLDSVVMTRILVKLPLKLAVAHCNFQLRGEEADKDEVSVKSLAEELDLPYYYARFDTQKAAENRGVSIQMAARDLRYDWLEDVRVSQEYHFIATAHHLNDVGETMLLNLTKGTGIAGLHGILSMKEQIIRPLIKIERSDIEQYANEHKMTWREDASNQETKYQRNFIRHEIVPRLKEINPQVVKSMGNTAERLNDVEAIYKYGLEKALKRLTETRGDDIHIPINKLLLYPGPKTLLFELIRPYGFEEAQLDDIWDSRASVESKQFISNTHRIIKARKHFIVTSKEGPTTNYILLEKLKRNVNLSDRKLLLRLGTKNEISIKETDQFAYVDYDKLEFPLQFRRWTVGDYFYPLGMNKKKKLKRFFSDKKFSQLDKERAWVMVSGDRIAWIVGHRIDDRFKITESTKSVLELKLP